MAYKRKPPSDAFLLNMTIADMKKVNKSYSWERILEMIKSAQIRRDNFLNERKKVYLDIPKTKRERDLRDDNKSE